MKELERRSASKKGEDERGRDEPFDSRRRRLKKAHVVVDVGIEEPMSDSLPSFDTFVVWNRRQRSAK